MDTQMMLLKNKLSNMNAHLRDETTRRERHMESLEDIKAKV